MTTDTTATDIETIRLLVSNIKELYVEITDLRNQDRTRYKELNAKLEQIERERSLRTKKNRHGTRKAKKAAASASQSKASTPGGPNTPNSGPKQKSSNNKVADFSIDTQKTDEKPTENE